MVKSDNFHKIVEKVYTKSPLQKKKLQQYLDSMDDNFFNEAEEFAVQYMGYMENQNILLDYAVDSYLEMCHNMMKSQIEFMKTDKYTIDLHSKAYEEVYSNTQRMKSYMIGLAISQFLWETHYGMYSFFAKNIQKLSKNIHTYLEIGPGHGLFLKKALGFLGDEVKVDAVDISAESISITKSIMNYFKPGFKNITYHNSDILKFETDKKFDFVTMGEVLEHVNFPDKLLTKIRDLLNDGRGRSFVSTCVNCPAIDHVYHFKHVDDIRKLINSCGLEIVDEAVLPVENLPMEEIVEKKITINYCSLLKRS